MIIKPRIFYIILCGFSLLLFIVMLGVFIDSMQDMINNPYLYENGSKGAIVCFFMGVMCLLFIDMYVSCIFELSSTITCDEKGILNKNHFYEEYLEWEEVKYYGVTEGLEKSIYLFGRRLSLKEQRWIYYLLDRKLGFFQLWYPSVVRKKRNQEKKDIIIIIPYKKERWEYISRMMSNREKLLRERLEEVEGKL